MEINPQHGIKPISDFRKESSQILKTLLQSREPILLTQRGRSVAVLLDIDTFEKLEKSAKEEPFLNSSSRSTLKTKRKTLLKTKKKEILKLAKKHGASNIRLFGSVLRGEDRPDSDIDLLIDMKPPRSLFDLVAFEQDLESLLKNKVDVVTEEGLDPEIRKNILKNSIPL